MKINLSISNGAFALPAPTPEVQPGGWQIRPAFAYAKTPIAALPLLPTVIGRPLGVMNSCSIGRPAA